MVLLMDFCYVQSFFHWSFLGFFFKVSLFSVSLKLKLLIWLAVLDAEHDFVFVVAKDNEHDNNYWFNKEDRDYGNLFPVLLIFWLIFLCLLILHAFFLIYYKYMSGVWYLYYMPKRCLFLPLWSLFITPFFFIYIYIYNVLSAQTTFC
jgi:hypothetical protein